MGEGARATTARMLFPKILNMRCGEPIRAGAVSTLFDTPHHPGDRELRLMDLLARGTRGLLAPLWARPPHHAGATASIRSNCDAVIMSTCERAAPEVATAHLNVHSPKKKKTAFCSAQSFGAHGAN